jgi:hypothetical protein
VPRRVALLREEGDVHDVLEQRLAHDHPLRGEGRDARDTCSVPPISTVAPGYHLGELAVMSADQSPAVVQPALTPSDVGGGGAVGAALALGESNAPWGTRGSGYLQPGPQSERREGLGEQEERSLH